MILSTTGDVLFAAPLSAEPTGILQRLYLEDLSTSRMLWHLQGNANRTLQRILGDELTTVSRVLVQGKRLAVCLRPGHIFVMAERTDRSLADDLLTAGDPLAVTDITHGRGVLHLSGKLAVDMLPKLCGLNFSDESFPHLHAAQTSFTRVKALLIRNDGENYPAYTLVVDRSHAQYVWDVTVDAMQEFV